MLKPAGFLALRARKAGCQARGSINGQFGSKRVKTGQNGPGRPNQLVKQRGLWGVGRPEAGLSNPALRGSNLAIIRVKRVKRVN